MEENLKVVKIEEDNMESKEEVKEIKEQEIINQYENILGF